MSDEQRPAFEAEAKAEGHRPKAEGHEAEATVALLAHDRKAARILAEAEAARVRTKAAIEAKDADAIRKAEADEARLKIEVEEAKAKAEARASRKDAKNKAWAVVVGRFRGLIAKVQSEAAASYSAFVYMIAVTVAVTSQGQGIQKIWADANDYIAIGAGFVIEAIGLAFYATSVAQRLDNRSGLIPRLVAWGFTGFAATMQFWVHSDVKFQDKPVLSYALMTITISAMLLAEVRTTHKVGKALEDLGQKDGPLARLGLKFCLRYPDLAWFALSAMIASPSIRTRGRALKIARRIKTIRYRKAINRMLMGEASKALKAVRKAKASEAILFRLNELAFVGLEAVGVQEALASAPEAVLAEAEAEEANLASKAGRSTIKAEATVQAASEASNTQRPRIVPKRPTPALRPRPVAQVEAKADGAGGPDDDWANRPGNNPFAWEQRLAELAFHFPGNADSVPSRQTCIDYFRSEKDAGRRVRFAWTNKQHVGFALADLKRLRSLDAADPKLNEEHTDSPA